MPNQIEEQLAPEITRFLLKPMAYSFIDLGTVATASQTFPVLNPQD
jgi:hypothetical protein